MILVVGATSRVGKYLIPLLRAKGYAVRAMTRTPEKAQELKDQGVEVVQGDLRDAASLAKALQGADQVVASAQGFVSTDPTNNIHTVDDAGNRALIDAAKAAGVKHFVFISVQGAAPDSPMEMFRIKYDVEQYLKASGMGYAILRPTAFMEFWGAMIGGPVLAGGKANIFGDGKNPVNFVSAADVASFVMVALEDQRASDQTIVVGGPENLTLDQVASIFEKVSGKTANLSHMPVPVMRIMRGVMSVVKPPLAAQITGGILMASTDQTYKMDETLKEYPTRLHTMEEVAKHIHQS